MPQRRSMSLGFAHTFRAGRQTSTRAHERHDVRGSPMSVNTVRMHTSPARVTKPSLRVPGLNVGCRDAYRVLSRHLGIGIER